MNMKISLVLPLLLGLAGDASIAIAQSAGTFTAAGSMAPRASHDGRLAGILYFGPAPGYTCYSQVNFRVPADVATGAGVPVRLMYLGRSSNAVTIGVQ
jgi:uncharacterized protein (TIGR03437 family)